MLKRFFLGGILAAIGAACAQAAFVGRLDLASDPQAIVLRDLEDGLWLVGLQKDLWKLWHVEARSKYLKTETEILHLSFFVASRLEGQAPAYGPAVGTNVGPLARGLAEKISLVKAAAKSSPPWLGKLGDWTSLDFYTGYRPVISPDEHRWMWGVGGKVRIPFGDLVQWARGRRDVEGLPNEKGL